MQVCGITLSDRTFGIIEKRRSLYLRKASDCGRSLMKSFANYLNRKDITLKIGHHIFMISRTILRVNINNEKNKNNYIIRTIKCYF